MKALLFACVLTIFGIQARAEVWPEHGFYWVQDGVEQGGRYCELRAELKVNGAIFALVIHETGSGSVMAGFMTQVHDIDKAKQIIVSIDHKEIFRFTPEVRHNSPELPSMAAYFDSDQGGAIIDQLHKAAKGAQWLQVVASPYDKVVPAKGLDKAMDNLVACRSARGI